jgi:hypothetical protein
MAKKECSFVRPERRKSMGGSYAVILYISVRLRETITSKEARKQRGSEGSRVEKQSTNSEGRKGCGEGRVKDGV